LKLKLPTAGFMDIVMSDWFTRVVKIMPKYSPQKNNEGERTLLYS
jgi:hypothetical protein